MPYLLRDIYCPIFVIVVGLAAATRSEVEAEDRDVLMDSIKDSRVRCRQMKSILNRLERIGTNQSDDTRAVRVLIDGLSDD